MPLTDRMIHSLAIVTPTDAGTLDERGQPVEGEPRVEVAQGFVWPKTARELAQANQAGAQIADHSVVFPYRAVDPAAYIRPEPDDGVRYEVVGVEQHNYGSTPLVLVHARRVVASTLPGEGS
jgi:hypothetical protein